MFVNVPKINIGIIKIATEAQAMENYASLLVTLYVCACLHHEYDNI